MLKILLALVITLTCFNAVAGFEGRQANNRVGLFDKLDCSTGLTCTKVGDRFVVVSSPTISTGSLSITGAESTNAILSLIADEGDDNGDTWKINSVASGNALTFTNNTSGSDVTKMSLSTAGELSGYKSPQVAASATTITASQCGSTFSNAGAVEMDLPEASTVIGCRLTFVTLNASNFDIDPDAADQILVNTDAAGDKIRNATVGNSITLLAVSASQWAVVGILGTWSDAN